MIKYINVPATEHAFGTFRGASPFDHLVVDDFFLPEVAQALAAEFPASDSDRFNGHYENAIEIKNTCNIWDRFPARTYQVMQHLNSPEFLDFLRQHTGTAPLYADPGLHGGGWHTHPPGGKLNVHLDYSLHPKLGLQRKFNLLVYLNPEYQSGWGGELGLWNSDEHGRPSTLARTVEPAFNRAVFFDTTQCSWHGLEVPNKFPTGQDRKSLALYYLTDPPADVDTRGRALFVPSQDQQHDPAVLELIQRRSQVQGSDPTKWSRS